MEPTLYEITYHNFQNVKSSHTNQMLFDEWLRKLKIRDTTIIKDGLDLPLANLEQKLSEGADIRINQCVHGISGRYTTRFNAIQHSSQGGYLLIVNNGQLIEPDKKLGERSEFRRNWGNNYNLIIPIELITLEVNGEEILDSRYDPLLERYQTPRLIGDKDKAIYHFLGRHAQSLLYKDHLDLNYYLETREIEDGAQRFNASIEAAKQSGQLPAFKDLLSAENLKFF